MFRGHLRFFVLHALAKEDMAGYRLMKVLGEDLGTKPSPGSIYPILDELKKKEYISCKELKRKKVYSITKKGKDFLKEALELKEEFLEKVQKIHEMLEPEQSKQNKKDMHYWQGSLPKSATIEPELRQFMRTACQKLEEHNGAKKIKSFLKEKTKELKSL
ncbi:MAG: PadR family transcriptional regulator [archaeon]